MELVVAAAAQADSVLAQDLALLLEHPTQLQLGQAEQPVLQITEAFLAVIPYLAQLRPQAVAVAGHTVTPEAQYQTALMVDQAVVAVLANPELTERVVLGILRL